MQWECPILLGAGLNIERDLCMIYEEDCRAAVFGKTERTVG